jgi:bisphosphoglycerate-dependent phosphoglycerate mutase
MLLWYVAWFTASVSRPLILATIICMLTNPKAAQAKVKLIIMTFQFLFLCKDKKWKKPEDDPASFFTGDDDDKLIEKKTVIFLRHGESTWNDTFNKGDRKMSAFLLNFLPNLFKAFATEWYFLVSGKSDESWFFDSPLSEKGKSQAEGLQKFLRDTNPEFSTPKEANLIRLLKGEAAEGKCQMMSSNLRRAISTIAIGLQDRLDKRVKDDKVIILAELQEASVNPDALSIHPAKAPLVTSWMDAERVKEIYSTQCDTSKNTGNKSLTGNGLERMESFCRIIFEEMDASSVVATGHSYWFRAFFQTYLPWSFEHMSKKNKLINGGVVGFTLMRKKTEKGYQYMIDSNSLVILYGGF